VGSVVLIELETYILKHNTKALESSLLPDKEEEHNAFQSLATQATTNSNKL